MLSQELGLDPNLPYFNAGVLLIDTPYWRREKVNEKATTYLRENHDVQVLKDQEALNVVYAGKWKALHYEWNLIYSENPGYTPEHKAELQRRLQSTPFPKIIHYIGAQKPWDLGTLTGGSPRFLKAAFETEWFTKTEIAFMSEILSERNKKNKEV